jgi:hypothetical protein
MLKSVSKAFAEVIFVVLRAWEGRISQDVRDIYLWGMA